MNICVLCDHHVWLPPCIVYRTIWDEIMVDKRVVDKIMVGVVTGKSPLGTIQDQNHFGDPHKIVEEYEDDYEDEDEEFGTSYCCLIVVLFIHRILS